MKNFLILLTALVSLTSFGQEKVKYNGLNRNIPDNLEVGIKGNVNLYFASYKSISDDAFEARDEVSESIGGGFGFYGHFLFTEHVGLQTELSFNYRTGNSTSLRGYDVDTARTIIKEELSDYSTMSMEIPVYLKFHWEFTPIRRGHWKSKSQLGVFVGPRLIINPLSKRDLSRATTTRIYDHSSLSVNNDAESFIRYNSTFGMGVSLGVDYQLWNGFMVHAAYYRGLTSHVNKLNGVTAMDNRIEVGLGFRFN